MLLHRNSVLPFPMEINSVFSTGTTDDDSRYDDFAPHNLLDADECSYGNDCLMPNVEALSDHDEDTPMPDVEEFSEYNDPLSPWDMMEIDYVFSIGAAGDNCSMPHVEVLSDRDKDTPVPDMEEFSDNDDPLSTQVMMEINFPPRDMMEIDNPVGVMMEIDYVFSTGAACDDSLMPHVEVLSDHDEDTLMLDVEEFSDTDDPLSPQVMMEIDFPPREMMEINYVLSTGAAGDNYLMPHAEELSDHDEDTPMPGVEEFSDNDDPLSTQVMMEIDFPPQDTMEIDNPVGVTMEIDYVFSTGAAGDDCLMPRVEELSDHGYHQKRCV